MFEEISQSIYGVFASPQWSAAQIPAVPFNFQGVTPDGTHIKVSVIPGRPEYLSHSKDKKLSGLLVLSVFTDNSSGQLELFKTADILDTFFQSKRIGKVDFGVSTCRPVGVDPDNPTLYRGDYSISFVSNGE
jgi:hypothetical protein